MSEKDISCGCGHTHSEHHESKEEKCSCGHDHHAEKACSCKHEHEHEHGHGEACGCHHEHHGHHDDRDASCSCGCDHDHEEEDSCGCGCGHDHGHEPSGGGKAVLRYLLGAIPAVIAFCSFLPVYVTVPAALLVYIWFGFDVWRDMIGGFRRKKVFTEFTLMCVASLGAFVIGEYADAAAVMYLYSLGESISSGAYARSRKNLSELLEITPEYATLLRDGAYVRVSPQEVDVGESILVVAGERVPLDGRVISGGGNADTSSVTGEAKPLELTVGVSCPSGSILTDGSVCLEVEHRYENSVVAKLSAAVKEAQKKKSPTERKISRFAGIFTPLAFAVAAAVALIGSLVTGEVAQWVSTGLAVLVVSCPCSMVLSVPLTYFAGIGAGAKRGIVFRGGETLDAMADVKTVLFDKTGTLTEAGLRFDGARLYGSADEKEFYELAYSVLLHSPHVAARSFCDTRSGDPAYAISEVRVLGGRGVICLADGKQALFGNAALLRENGIEAEDSKETAIFGAWDGRLLGKLCFSSHLKPQAAESLSALRRHGVRRMAVLSGDGEDSVRSVCDDLGISEYYAPLMPHEKLERFDTIYAEAKKADARASVAYCGDGLNDSAVIAGADVGIAMGGSGSALTVTEADVVIMDDSLAKVAEAVDIAKKTSAVAGQNIALSVGIKAAVLVVSIVFAAVTHKTVPLELAIVADVGAAVVAVLNALRAAKYSK